LQQQRHPGLGEDEPAKRTVPQSDDLFGLTDNDNDVIADKRVIDRLSNIARAHALNEGERDQPLPSF
jgi:type IV secretion system protein VirD4